MLPWHCPTLAGKKDWMGSVKNILVYVSMENISLSIMLCRVPLSCLSQSAYHKLQLCKACL